MCSEAALRSYRSCRRLGRTGPEVRLARWPGVSPKQSGDQHLQMPSRADLQSQVHLCPLSVGRGRLAVGLNVTRPVWLAPRWVSGLHQIAKLGRPTTPYVGPNVHHDVARFEHATVNVRVEISWSLVVIPAGWRSLPPTDVENAILFSDEVEGTKTLARGCCPTTPSDDMTRTHLASLDHDRNRLIGPS